MLRAYFGENFVHRPDRSGLPSEARGAGAVRFGLPSAVRGMPGVWCLSHCAASGVLRPTARIATTMLCMATPRLYFFVAFFVSRTSPAGSSSRPSQDSSAAFIVIVAFSTRDTGQPAFALFAAVSKAALSAPGI